MPRTPKAPKRPPPVRYGPGHYAPAPNGRGYDCTVVRAGVRSRTRAPTEQEARAWIDSTDAATADSLPPLTRAQLLDARDALRQLPPGVTLSHAAAAYRSARSAPPTVALSAARDAFLEDRITAAVRPATLSMYRQASNRLIRSSGDLPVSSLTPAHLEALVSGLAPASRNGLLRHLSAFLNWTMARGHATDNPALRVTRARLPEPPRGILTVRQIEALLACAAAARPALVPYLALGLFAGIRPEELRRLRPSKIGSAYILIDGTVAKTADTRTVTVRPNLAAWLAAYPIRTPRVPPLSAKHLYAAIRAIRTDTLLLSASLKDPALAIRDWPTDCMRHSHASYLYELTKDAAAVSAEMGHAGIGVFFRHYRALSRPGEGLAFTSITPESVAVLIAECQRFTQPVDNQQ